MQKVSEYRLNTTPKGTQLFSGKRKFFLALFCSYVQHSHMNILVTVHRHDH